MWPMKLHPISISNNFCENPCNIKPTIESIKLFLMIILDCDIQNFFFFYFFFFYIFFTRYFYLPFL